MITTQYKDLEAFNEFAQSNALVKKGDISNALPLMKRVHEITSSATGADSLLSVAASVRLSKLYCISGSYSSAETALCVPSLKGLSKAYALQFLSEVRLLAGDPENSLIAAEEACDLAEEQNSADTDVTVFYGCYTMKGLSHLCLGHEEEAEDLLQQAARWSPCNGPSAQLKAMSNLGTCQWREKDEGDDVKRLSETMKRDGGDIKEDKEQVKEMDETIIRSVRHALEIFEEGLVEAAAKDTEESGSGGMCGPTMDVAAVGGNKKKSEVMAENRDKNEILVERSKELEFAIAYSNLLCSTAQAHRALRHDTKAAKLLLSALKALETHDEASVLPVRGRVLGLMGRAHMRSGNAVTAEGLFRSAVDAMKTPYALHDIRYKYELSVIQMAYGGLLSKWDKREVLGERFQKESQELLSSLPVFPASFRLSPSFELPLF
eukprot:CAMPEP_0182424236 /NCGR_PEP_ID=MMETSP1167-20130531/10405_1 /TAXON_ID=2988 /ORGANISM="Mallomonas Sp, Strain CCMP3275" /LENGTH=434 /DNA_ID=CAMNT_0024603879 /DNA_START=213 /DNA_END=1517 /DNA_ORIENTATION=+